MSCDIWHSVRSTVGRYICRSHGYINRTWEKTHGKSLVNLTCFEIRLLNGLSLGICCTGTSFIQKIYAPSFSLLQGKHLPFTPSPLRLYIFRLFVILSLTQLYRSTPEIFLFSTATLSTGPPSDKLDKNSEWMWLIKNFSKWNGNNHFRSGLNWFRKLKKGALKIKCQ
jgi:hypothetical protein